MSIITQRDTAPSVTVSFLGIKNQIGWAYHGKGLVSNTQYEELRTTLIKGIWPIIQSNASDVSNHDWFIIL